MSENVEKNVKKKSDKIARTVSGLIMAGVLFFILWLTKFESIIFDALIMLVLIVATREVYFALKRADTKRLDKPNGYRVSKYALALNILMIYPMCRFYGYTGLFITFIVAFSANFINFIFDPKKDFTDFAAGIFTLVYPTAILGIVFVLHNTYGMIPVVLAIGISTISDALAFWVGVLFGKKKIFPKISPKKTYAGCVGGLFGGALGGMMVYGLFEVLKFPTNTIFTFGSIISYPIILYAVIGFFIAAFSEVGDLAASRLKRQVGIKDYGTSLGSHGGVLDRIDSILFTIICMAIIMFIVSAVS